MSHIRKSIIGHGHHPNYVNMHRLNIAYDLPSLSYAIVSFILGHISKSIVHASYCVAYLYLRC